MRPLICPYVGFLEAGIRPLRNGCAKAMLTLKSGTLGLLDLVKALGRRLGNFYCGARLKHGEFGAGTMQLHAVNLLLSFGTMASIAALMGTVTVRIDVC
jgi:hypothetical protein